MPTHVICPSGMTYRKSYTRKGTRVSSKCIRSQTRSPRQSVNRIRFRSFRLRNRTLKTCPSGYIKRSAYVRSSRSKKRLYIPEQCIRDMGAPGKGFSGGPGIGSLRKGDLAQFGYIHVAKLPIELRQAALTKAINAYGSLGVWRKLNAVHIYTRRTSPLVSEIFKADMDWIKSTFGIKAF